MICLFFGKTRHSCSGRCQDHHVIPQRTIRDRYRTMRYIDVIPPFSLTAALKDRRNIVYLCALTHHPAVEAKQLDGKPFYIERKDLPDGIDDFAEALDLGWYLARYFGD